MKLLITIISGIIVAGCGGNDATSGQDMTTNLDMTIGQPCIDTSQCPGPNFVCAFQIADGCAAKGHCMPVATPTCASILLLCGCDGRTVPSGPCYFAPGYAGGATTGASAPACLDGGT
jgi:hypothetical protein